MADMCSLELACRSRWLKLLLILMVMSCREGMLRMGAILLGLAICMIRGLEG
jgi:hypothetical protein